MAGVQLRDTDGERALGVDAPTRSLWVPLGYIYTVLVVAFGCGVWTLGDRSRVIRIVGSLIVVYGALGPFWPPMHLREVLAAGGGTTTDTMHIAFAMVTVALMLLAIGFGSMAFGRSFRVYSIATLIVLFAFGLLTARESPAIALNRPTPFIGVWERINIGAFMLWVIVLAATLMRAPARRDNDAPTVRGLEANNPSGRDAGTVIQGTI